MASAPTGTASEHAGTASELTSAASRAADTSANSFTRGHVRGTSAARSVTVLRDDGNASGDTDTTGRIAVGMHRDECQRAHVGAGISENIDAIVLLPAAKGPVARQEGAFRT